MSDKKFELKEVSGVEGNSLYLNDYRISGPKPWGGGTVLKTWIVEENSLRKAIPDLFQKKISVRKKAK